MKKINIKDISSILNKWSYINDNHNLIQHEEGICIYTCRGVVNLTSYEFGGTEKETGVSITLTPSNAKIIAEKLYESAINAEKFKG